MCTNYPCFKIEPYSRWDRKYIVSFHSIHPRNPSTSLDITANRSFIRIQFQMYTFIVNVVFSFWSIFNKVVYILEGRGGSVVGLTTQKRKVASSNSKKSSNIYRGDLINFRCLKFLDSVHWRARWSRFHYTNV